MKKYLLLNFISLLLLSVVCKTYGQDETYQNGQENIPDQASISFQNFYDDLSPYGQWINYPGYGYVWAPAVGNDFKPYASNGHWVYTDMGWTWVSGYDWGWAAFHYGRWLYDNSYGWLWIPGYEWAPAWVSWRSSDDYYGWAPLSPEINGGFAVETYDPPSNYWCFVPHQYVNSPVVYNYYVQETENVTIINNTTVINNTSFYNRGNDRYRSSDFQPSRNARYAAGPNYRDVERFTHNAIRPVVIRNNSRAGTAQINNGALYLFRPAVNTSGSSQRFAPARIEPFRGSLRADNNRYLRSAPVINNNFRGNERYPSNANGGAPLNINTSRPPQTSAPVNSPAYRNYRNQVVNNQPADAVADSRRNYNAMEMRQRPVQPARPYSGQVMNSGRNMQPSTMERPVFNNESIRRTDQPRSYNNASVNNAGRNMQQPVVRENREERPANVNAYRQSPVQQQRFTPQSSPQPAGRSFSPAPPVRQAVKRNPYQR